MLNANQIINIQDVFQQDPVDFTLIRLSAIFLCEGKHALYLLLTSHKTELTMVLIQKTH